METVPTVLLCLVFFLQRQISVLSLNSARANKPLLVATFISVLSTLVVIYTPALQFMFQTVVLDLTDLAVVAVLSLSGFLLISELLLRRQRLR
jgi:polyferredoxin